VQYQRSTVSGGGNNGKVIEAESRLECLNRVTGPVEVVFGWKGRGETGVRRKGSLGD